MAKVESIEVVASKKQAGFQNEGSDARTARMERFWLDPNNGVIVKVGKLLAQGNLAQLVAEGEELEMPEFIKVNSLRFKLTPGLVISLSNIGKSWGCPACGSAHGSGVYPSRDIDSSLLAKTDWYYNPRTLALFTISRTCFDVYVSGIAGAAKHILDATDYALMLKDAAKAKAEAEAKAKAEAEAKAKGGTK